VFPLSCGFCIFSGTNGISVYTLHNMQLLFSLLVLYNAIVRSKNLSHGIILHRLTQTNYKIHKKDYNLSICVIIFSSSLIFYVIMI
jgi:hypothetical protein